MIAKTIRTCFPIAAAAVSDKAEEINKLNVFPVPDGDTGTNMSLTLASVTKELSALPADADMEAIAGAITHGSLMGARGNSGVITSQILRGVAEGLVSADEPITSANIAFAFRRAVKVAFQAVRKPIEGTILTVLRDVSTKADECEKKKFSAEDALDAIVVEAYQSVARTPDLLPVLKENGVVDSGAFGFAIFLENFVAAALGRSTVVEDFSATFDSAGSARDAALGRVEIEANDDWEGSEFRYCNEFLFKADAPFDEDECLKFLGSMGDCELLVGAYPDYKIHVHSNTPNLVLEHMLQLGQIYEVFIHNMEMEAHDRTAKIHEDQEKAAEPAKALGFVAVAAGSGEADILKSLGVDVIVSGGQTMNPRLQTCWALLTRSTRPRSSSCPTTATSAWPLRPLPQPAPTRRSPSFPPRPFRRPSPRCSRSCPIPSSRMPSPLWSTPSARSAMARSPAPCATPAPPTVRQFTPVTSWASLPAPSMWSAPT